MRKSWLAAAAPVALALVVAGAARAGAATGSHPAATTAGMLPDGDGPHGFWWGTDSWPVPVRGSAPYRMPYLGGAYGGYIGMTGNWAYWQGCKGTQEHFLAFSSKNYAQAHTNYVKHGLGIGDSAYWFMGGPGVDPHWNGTASEAYSWGRRQAARVLWDMTKQHIDYPVVWMDIELPGDTPAPDNGWNSVYTSPCSGVKKRDFVPAAVDRADFNGFWNYVSHHSKYKPGVYSSPGVWKSIFGPGSASGGPGHIPHTDEWTYEPETTNYTGNAPHGWCLHSGGCAHFFGGVGRSSSHALVWQWSGGGGQLNGIGGYNGDLDQIDSNRQK